MSIKVESASIARGYSGYDHLLNDRPLQAMIGRTYRDLAAAGKAAQKILNGTQDERCSFTPVHINGFLVR